MNAPIRPPSNNDDPRLGSMGLGFALGFGVAVGSTLLSVMMMSLASTVSYRLNEVFVWPALMLPPGAMIALIVWAFASGRTRTGAGVLASIGAMIAVGILLVAACFGIVATMH